MTRRPRMVTGASMPLVPTILLGDADPAAQEMMRDALLEGVGPARLRTAGSTAELHAAIGQASPSLVIVDGDLPPNGAIDAVRSIKSNTALRRIPVVLILRRLDPEAVAEAYDAGANTVIAKPVTFLALVKLMKVFTAYWLDSAVLPAPEPPLPAAPTDDAA